MSLEFDHEQVHTFFYLRFFLFFKQGPKKDRKPVHKRLPDVTTNSLSFTSSSVCPLLIFLGIIFSLRRQKEKLNYFLIKVILCSMCVCVYVCVHLLVMIFSMCVWMDGCIILRSVYMYMC